MTLLEIVQRFCTRTGIPSPTFVVGSTDSQIKQLQGLLDELCEDLVTRFKWTGLQREANFTTLAAEDQGALAAIAPGIVGASIINDTIFNRTLRLPIYGPMPGDKWQALKALPTTGPFYKFRVRNGRMLFNPAPPVGQNCYFEYYSKYIVTDTTGTILKAYTTADTDTFLLDDTLILAGLRMKWKMEKGLPYAEEFQRFEELIANLKGQDGAKPVICMDHDEDRIAFPGVFISPFNTVGG